MYTIPKNRRFAQIPPELTEVFSAMTSPLTYMGGNIKEYQQFYIYHLIVSSSFADLTYYFYRQY
jgi:hypothetical protein